MTAWPPSTTNHDRSGYTHRSTDPLPDPACGELWGQTVTESAARLEQIADNIGYETEDEQGISTTDADFEDIDPSYRLVDITNIDPHIIIVTYSADPIPRPRHPNCQ